MPEIIPDFILSLNSAQQSLLKNAFEVSGQARVIPKIIAYFLTRDKPVKKSDLLQIGLGIELEDLPGKGRGYYSIYFSVLSTAKILRYNTSSRCLEKDNNFTAYVEYLIARLLFGRKDKAKIIFTPEQLVRLETNMYEVVSECAREKDALRSLRILITGNKDQGQDFILNL
jgi:hypothetical protein